MLQQGTMYSHNGTSISSLTASKLDGLPLVNYIYEDQEQNSTRIFYHYTWEFPSNKTDNTCIPSSKSGCATGSRVLKENDKVQPRHNSQKQYYKTFKTALQAQALYLLVFY